MESEFLDGIYAKAEIPASNPEERSRYLAEDVLDLSMLDHDLVMRTAAKDGRHVALNVLEELAIQSQEP